MKKLLKILTNRVVLIGFLLLVQLVWIVSTVYKFSNNYIEIDLILGILSVFIVLYVIGRRDNPAYKMAWIVLILEVPIFGVLMYLMFESRKASKNPLRGEERRRTGILCRIWCRSSRYWKN